GVRLSLVDLQEKLMLTVGRHRKKVAIGIHDMDKVTPPYTYKAVLPEDVRCTPLGMAEEMDLREILAKHEKGREYAHLVASKPRFPIITDARGEVLSFPPVINGIRTQLTPDTRNLFIDVTGTDLEAVSGCLAILSTALAERGGRIQTVRTIGEYRGANDFAETLRVLLVGYGYQEVMSLTIASSKDAFDTSDRVVIRNPLNEELTTLRSSMLPALMNIFRLNKHRELPQ